MALQHLRASVANKRPAPSGMSDGQLAVNTNDASPGLFLKNAGGTLVKIGPVHVGTTAPNATPASGGTSGNTTGELWLDSTGGDYALKTWDGSAWQTTVVTSGMIKDGTIGNADINDSAAIALSKLAIGALPTSITISSDNVVDGTITNNDINASAGITYSKLALSSGIVDADISGSAAIALSKLATGALPTGITVSSGNIVDGTITNADVNASAGIVYSKLVLSSGIVDADISGSAAIALSKLATGALPIGITIASGNITDGTIANADVNASAAIAGTKISPDFGGQNITTSGNIATSGTTTTATLIASGDIQATSFNGGALAGMRNRIINGGMDIAQRGTSFAAIANATYTIDRWLWQQNGAMVCTVTQSTDVPNNTFQSSYKVDVTTVDSSIAASEYALVTHVIEGYNARDLIGTTFTLSFWVKSPKTGTHCVAFRNNGLDRSFIKEYTIATANTWEYKTLTVTGGLITAGTWNWKNGIGLDILFVLANGTTYQTTADAWQTGNFFATANQVNVMDNTANDFFITGVQLEPGAVATPFERRIYGQELALCQRYYEKSYNISIAPGTASSSFGVFSVRASSNNELGTISFKQRKRGNPTIILYNFATGATGTWRDGSAVTDKTVAAGNIGESSFIFDITSSVDGNQMLGHWTATAEF